MRTRFILRLILVVAPTVGLMLLWLAFLPRAGQAAGPGYGRAAPAPTAAPTAAPTPDPRWVEIVRGRDAGRASPDAQPISMNINLTQGLAAGRVPSAALVQGVVLDEGVPVDWFTTLPLFDGTGFLYWAYLSPSNLKPGSVVQVTQGASAITMTMPLLTSLAYPQTDLLSGSAPANAALTAFLFPFTDPEQVYTRTVTASAGGMYLIDWSPGVDLRPQDSGYLVYTQDDTRQASVAFAAPFLRVQAGGPNIHGVAAPAANYEGFVHIVVEDAAGGVLIDVDTYVDGSGNFDALACVDYWTDNCIRLAPTDRVIATASGQTFSMTVPLLTVQADLQARTVSGQAPPQQPVKVVRFQGPDGEWSGDLSLQTPQEQAIVTATAAGEYTALMQLQSGNYGGALVTNSAGYECFANYHLPYLHTRLGKPPDREYYDWVRLWGNISIPNDPITVEIEGPSGYLKDWYTIESQSSGFFYDLYDPQTLVSLESGDRVTLTAATGPQFALLMPVLTAEVDPDTDILSGLAPPFAQLVVTLEHSLQITATADAEGQYSLDLSSLGMPYYYSAGSVTWTNPDGYTVERVFRLAVEEDCPPRLDSAQIGGNIVEIRGDFYCGPLTFRLRGPGGYIKFERTYEWTQDLIYLYDENWAPILIDPGDQIEIISGVQVETTVVPNLTAQLDAQLDHVSGIAPPLSVVQAFSDWTAPVLTTTANAQGAYLISLAGFVDLDAGSAIRVTLVNSPHFYTIGVLEGLTAYLYEIGFQGRLQPFTPYTIRLHTPLTVSAEVTGTADHTGFFANSIYPPPEGLTMAKPGDRYEMETPSRAWELTLPWLTAHVNVATGLVSGEAPAGSRLKISIPQGCDCSAIITANDSGTYSTVMPITPGADFLSGSITHYTGQDTRTVLNFHPAQWIVTLGSSSVSVSNPMAGAPVTVTLYAADGAFVQTIAITDTLYGGIALEFIRPIEPGDRLTMESVDGGVSKFTVPFLSAVYDFPSRVLKGRAPPVGKLSAYIPGEPYSGVRHIRVGPNGFYGLDASDLVPDIGGQGYVIYTDLYGNQVYRSYMILGYPIYLPVIRHLATAP